MKTNKFKNFLRILFARIFNLSYEVDNKLVRKHIYTFLYIIKEWKYLDTISYVKVYRKNEKLIVEIETHRPEILIGMRGSLINELTEFLKKELNTDLEIKLKECQLWHKLF